MGVVVNRYYKPPPAKVSISNKLELYTCGRQAIDFICRKFKILQKFHDTRSIIYQKMGSIYNIQFNDKRKDTAYEKSCPIYEVIYEINYRNENFTEKIR
jgi:hypothetical protein